MARSYLAYPLIQAGDLEGLDKVYTQFGEFIREPGEKVVATFHSADIGAFGSWRPIFPKHIFSPYTPPRNSRLYITNHRIVLLREIDIPKEIRPLMIPTGMWGAYRRERGLRDILASNGRYFCFIRSSQLSSVRVLERRKDLFMKLLGSDGSKYAVFFLMEENGKPMFDVIKRQFPPARKEGPERVPPPIG